MTNRADGSMDEVHAWRDHHGADLVALLTDATDVGGVGWLLTDRRGNPRYAFCLGGAVGPGGSATITAIINNGVAALSPGTHQARLAISEADGGRSQQRPISLTIVLPLARALDNESWGWSQAAMRPGSGRPQ